MAFTTKDVRPVFEAQMGATRRFVVKGDVAFAVLNSGEPVLGFVNFYGNKIHVESFVTRNSAPVPLSVVHPSGLRKKHAGASVTWKRARNGTGGERSS